MEHSMKLHQESKLFYDTLRATAQHLDIKFEFVEKDYWITLVLAELSKSKFRDNSVFKGGTSLSKGHKLIDRFSEDVDLAIIDDGNKSGNEIKTIIRTLEKDITRSLTERPTAGVTSKGSRFRKSVFEYPTMEKNNSANTIIVEINSFANPFPHQKLSMSSMVYDFLVASGNEDYIETYNLNSFEINVLSKEQTLLEKLVSLIRFSFDSNPIESISQKIRHFYDLYYLIQNPQCAEFVESELFRMRFEEILQHDRDIFDEPFQWQNKTINESPLITDFDNFWAKIKNTYQTELSAYAYRPIPIEIDVAACFKQLTKRL
jgi:predicted nucleotidyltransferase component of viral defense system